MITSSCIEWVEFKLNAGVTESELRAASDALQSQFLLFQPGYQQRTLVRLDTPGVYADLVHWARPEDMKKAMATSSDHPVCGAYFALLEVLSAPSLGTAIAHHTHINNPSAVPPSELVLGGMEFSFFKPKPGVSDQVLRDAARHLAHGLYSGQPGYIHHFVVKSELGVYADVVLATSGKRAAELCASWGTGPFAEPCQPYLDLIDPESVQLAFFDALM